MDRELYTPTEFYQHKVKTWKWAVVFTAGHERSQKQNLLMNDFNKGFKERAEP